MGQQIKYFWADVGALFTAAGEEKRGQKLITRRKDGAEKWLLSGERVD